MATTTITKLVDDLDGSSEASLTVPFSIEGSRYEIDLNEKHADQFRKAVQPFMEKARRLSRTNATSARRNTARNTRPAAERRATNEEIRAWAKEKGIKVADKGRIANSVIEQFKSA